MLLRATLVWLAILVVAIGNGAVRDRWLIPTLGEQFGHVLSTISLCIAILLASFLGGCWIGPATRGDALRVGVLWLLLTLAFEFLGGHFLFGAPWSRLVADYDVLRGRIWILVLITTTLAPLLTFDLWPSGGTRRATGTASPSAPG